MARLSQVPYAAPERPVDPLVDLNRLLSRLQQTVLRADAVRERRLRANEYERTKVNTNIEYGRSLLARAEQDALGIKILSRRQEMQADLIRKRDMLDQVAERIRDLQEIAAADAAAEEDDETSSDGEDILAEIIATPSESMDSRSTDAPPIEQAQGHDDYEDHGWGGDEIVPEAVEQQDEEQRKPEVVEPEEEERAAHMSSVEKQPPTTTTSNTLRARGKPADVGPGEQEETEIARTTAAKLFEGRSTATSSSITTALSPTATTEAILDHQRAEQDALSESILRMASDLKSSSRAFASSLEEDRNVLGQASRGLDRNEVGLEAASRRMGTLRSMTEGRGWWGRVLLYAWIYGLMVALILVVFVLPKLRF